MASRQFAADQHSFLTHTVPARVGTSISSFKYQVVHKMLRAPQRDHLSEDGQRADSQSVDKATGHAELPSVLPIGVDTLRASALLQFDLYLEQEDKDALSLYRKCSYPLTQDDLDRLNDRGIQTVYIQLSDASSYRDYLRENVLSSEDIPPVRRYHALKEATRTAFQQSLSTGDLDATVEVTDDIGQGVVETVVRSKTSLSDLLQEIQHDDTLFSHSMNVSTYCLLLAWAIGIRDPKELVRIGQGAMLHDFGKKFLPDEMLKNGLASNVKDKQLVLQHPTRGFRELSLRKDLTWGQLMMIYQHHERCDGRGYPSGVRAARIHEYGRLCAIADVSDVLMRDHPASKSSLDPSILDCLDRQAGLGLDKEMTRCWIATLRRRN